MNDLQDKRLIVIKGFLFLAILILSTILLLSRHFDWPTFLLIALIVWSSARFYYFLFYVIEKYVDSRYKFAGIYSFLVYLYNKRRGR